MSVRHHGIRSCGRWSAHRAAVGISRACTRASEVAVWPCCEGVWLLRTEAILAVGIVVARAN